MGQGNQWKRPILLVGLYLGIAVPPYAALNWIVVGRVLERLSPPTPLEALGVLAVAVSLFGALVWAADGVDRFVQFLVAPTDSLSIFVGVSLLLAAASWWAVPEIVLAVAGRVNPAVLYGAVFASHVPLLLFLSLLTVVGIAHRRE
jgi:hypothetical protein